MPNVLVVLRRVFALLQAAWLALLVAEPMALHTCAMHSTGHGAAHAVAPPAQTAATSTLLEHAAHHAGVASSAPADGHSFAVSDASPDDAEAAFCQCLGQCCAAAVAALPAPALGAPMAAVTVRREETPAADVRGARAPDLVLPFAHGPPSQLTA